MTDKLHTFGCTFNVVKHEHCTMDDMELASDVLEFLRDALANPTLPRLNGYSIVKQSIHLIMIGPEGGLDTDQRET